MNPILSSPPSRRVRSSLRLSSLAALLVAAGCQSTGAAAGAGAGAGAVTQATIADEFTTTARVVAVDRTARTATLRREDGRLLAVRAGEAVRNFDRVQPGQTLRVQYRAMLVASKCPPGTATTPVEATVMAARAPAGAQPAAGVGAVVTVRVTIESVDPAHDIVVFAIPGGDLVAHRVATAEGRAFAAGLKVGDTVQLDYGEGVAIAIDELPRGD
jgi:hypothetical protein